MSVKETFIKNLKFFRKKKGLTQNQLTLEIDMGLGYINSVEQGIFFPQPDVIDLIANALGIRSALLFDEKATPENIVSNADDDFIEKITDKMISKIRKNLKSDFYEAIKEIKREIN